MYRYETHLHTDIGSACSRFTPEEIVRKYTRLGYRGVFVTDHFLNGNTTVACGLPWKERIERYELGYRAVKKAAAGKLDVFFGLESSYKGTDFLVYGLDGEWLAAHPEIMEMRVSALCPYLREAGALVVQAHPYREADYIDHIRLFPAEVDALEIINSCTSERANSLAATLAKTYRLRECAGSDIHSANQKELAGMQFDNIIASEQDFVERVKRGEGSIFTLTDEGVL